MPSSSPVTHQLEAAVRSPAARRGVAPSPADRPVPEARGVGQLLDATIDELKRHFAPLMGVALFLGLAAQLLQRALLLSVEAGSDSMVFAVLATAAFAPAQTCLNAYAFFVVGGEHLGTPHGPLRAGVETLRRLPVLLLLIAVALVLTLFTCGVGGFLVRWLTAPALGLLLLARTPLNALVPRTLELGLGWGSFGRWLGITVVTYALLGTLGGIELALDQPELRAVVLARVPLGADAFELLLMLLVAVIYALQMAVSAVSLVVFFVDLCVRRAGLDLRRRLRGLEATRTPEVAA